MQGRRRWWRALALVVGLLLAVAATATLVLTDDIRWLQLAVIAALWAFLIAAFVAGQRRTEPSAALAVPGAEIELAQRREIELLTEVRLRREIESGLRGELGAVREELVRVREDTARLRHDILERWDGELRVERIAVRAESTRYSGVGSTLAALQDEARRLQERGEPRQVTAAPRESDVVSTIEFSVVPPGPAPAAPRTAVDETGPVYGVRPTTSAEPAPPAAARPAPPMPVEEFATTVFPRIRDDQPPPTPATVPPPPSGGRHGTDGTNGSVDAATLLRRLQGEPVADEPPRRRRRARDDDAPNDVLARLIGERTG